MIADCENVLNRVDYTRIRTSAAEYREQGEFAAVTRDFAVVANVVTQGNERIGFVGGLGEKGERVSC